MRSLHYSTVFAARVTHEHSWVCSIVWVSVDSTAITTNSVTDSELYFGKSYWPSLNHRLGYSRQLCPWSQMDLHLDRYSHICC